MAEQEDPEIIVHIEVPTVVELEQVLAESAEGPIYATVTIHRSHAFKVAEAFGKALEGWTPTPAGP